MTALLKKVVGSPSARARKPKHRAGKPDIRRRSFLQNYSKV